MHQQQHIAMRVIHALYIDITGTQLRSIPRSRLQPAYRAVGAPSFSWGETFFAHAKSVKTPRSALQENWIRRRERFGTRVNGREIAVAV